MGRHCAQFEEAFASMLGVRNAIFVNSGSSANLLAFFALANPAIEGRPQRRLMPGDEVLVPAVTWPTTVWPIVQAGGIPVLIDCDPETLQIRTDCLREAITDRTAGICVVHVLGNAVPMSPVVELAREHRLWVVEDTCEALGTRHGGRFVGTFGDVATFSFYFSHHISTIEGGMLATDDDELADLIRVLRAHGWTRALQNRAAVEEHYPSIDPHYVFINTGFNVRPTEVNGALGLTQLPRLPELNRRRVEIARRWQVAFADLIKAGHLMPMRSTEQTDATWFGFPVLCASQGIRDAFKRHLEARSVETRGIICGNLARQPALAHIQHRIPVPLAGADRIMDCGIYWGAHPFMSDSEIDYVADVVKEFFK
jgi:CDP-6-deoxy-D-xylo-4-hexulose-3-dehydrase